jgi:hypothetical protein
MLSTDPQCNIRMPMRLTLASASPRRAELLRAAGIRFDVLPVDVDERFHPDETPEQAVARLAEAKAAAGAAIRPETIVLGADTTVVIDGQALAKPAQALRWLTPWAQIGGWLALPGGEAAPQIEPEPEVEFVRVADYVVPCAGPRRTLWLGRRAS